MAAPPLVAPSILTADFSELRSALKTMESSGADWLHLDVMDGNFVPNITFGSKMAADLVKHTRLPVDAHLMVTDPAKHFEAFAQAGVKRLTFHWEAAVHHHRLIQQLKSWGLKAGLAVVPSTPVQLLEPLLGELDLILVMTVNPGWGGQSFLEFTLQKVKWLKEQKDSGRFKGLIQVDGGVNLTSAPALADAGAEVLVTGSAFFDAASPSEFVEMIRTYWENT